MTKFVKGNHSKNNEKGNNSKQGKAAFQMWNLLRFVSLVKLITSRKEGLLFTCTGNRMA